MIIRRIIIAVLVGLLAVSSALASALPTPMPLPEPKIAPSYGAMANVNSVDRGTLDDGSVKYTYANVTTSLYERFGVTLGENGYSLSSSSVEGTKMTLVVDAADISLTLEYDSDTRVMSVIYPPDVALMERMPPEKYAGYVSVEMGKPFLVENLGYFTFTEWSEVESFGAKWFSTNWRPVKTGTDYYYSDEAARFINVHAIYDTVLSVNETSYGNLIWPKIEFRQKHIIKPSELGIANGGVYTYSDEQTAGTEKQQPFSMTFLLASEILDSNEPLMLTFTIKGAPDYYVLQLR